jgi:hypothetical protein
MSMNTFLKGRLKNTTLPKTHALLPLFEAVINSIHSIEERGIDFEESYIKVDIIRSNQIALDLETGQKPEITGFKITDNGIGFDNNNYISFQTFDSDYKAEKGCRGIGRLLWLKAFEKVSVISIFKDSEGNHQKRTFDFEVENDVCNENLLSISEAQDLKTELSLIGFKKPYLKYSKKTAETIAKELLEHCLWYFIRGGGIPKITVNDGEDLQNLDTIFEEYMIESSSVEKIELKEKEFNLIHVKLLTTSSRQHSIAYCAGNRVVKDENINGKIPGLYGALLGEDEKTFTYLGFITSEYLDESVRPERIGFNIQDESDGLFEDSDLSFKDIRTKMIEHISEYLSGYLIENKKKGRERVDNYVANRAPKYKSILNSISEDDLAVDPNINDKDLELTLHKYLFDIESKLLDDGHTLLSQETILEIDEYEAKLNDYLLKASDIKKSDLASYVSHRKVIIELLNKAIQKQSDGKYIREDFIHQLIMPMGKESQEIKSDDSNLWLVDERLAFHNYLASDKTLKSMPITDSTKTKEPDIMGLNVFDNPLLVNDGEELPLASIIVIEIKRPMRNDAKSGEEKDPIEQALKYLERVREGKVNTHSGRPIPESQNIPGFCYVLSDLTSSVKERCKLFGLKISYDKMGYFGYNDNYNAYIEVISFDKLVKAAKERNQAFFDKLGLSS